MKSFFHFKRIRFLTAMILVLANVHFASGQTEKKELIPIPENINKIFETSCMKCHGSTGGRLPKSRLNFSRWGAYGKAKEAEKASAMCAMVSKGKMPPKSARESNPELIPTKEQIDLICKWAESVKREKEKK